MEYTYDEYEHDEEIEYNPLDGILEQATNALLLAAKNNLAEIVHNLKTENARLTEENATLRRDAVLFAHKEHELQRKEAELERMAAKMPIEKFFGQRAVIMYKAENRKVGLPPKCDKCNEQRKIVFTSPRGVKMTEDCVCGISLLAYQPQEIRLVELRKDHMNLLMWFKSPEREDYGYSDGRLVKEENVYAGAEFLTIDKYNVYFRDIEQCQAYCDWLNRS